MLVSGANGFIAVWVVQDLLQAGFSVRGTVRSEGKAAHLKKLFGSYGDKFEIVVVADITQVGILQQLFFIYFIGDMLMTHIARRVRFCCSGCGCHRTHCFTIPL